jgi:hypothetical protein
MPTEWAIAIRCKTALVDPPKIIVKTCTIGHYGTIRMFENTIMPTIAFSKAERVIIPRGRIFFSRRLRITGPTESHSSYFSLDSAGKDDEPGNDMPKASIALAMVFAVYICNI